MSHRPHLLRNPIQRYAWGSRSAIPALLGVPPDGEPQAELWIGAHPKAPSRVVNDRGELPLDRWIEKCPEEILGPAVAARFGGELPFLLKVLAAELPLSIQAHPSAEAARAGFARENAAEIPRDAPHRSYRDPHHKPELICALTRFEALCGFREIAEIQGDFGRLDCDVLVEEVAGLADVRGLPHFFAALLRLSGTQRERLLAAARSRAQTESGPVWAWVDRLLDLHGDDVGALAPLALNLLVLEPGEALALPAGVLHSYLGGMGVELMANSDNVLRGGLTSKHVDVDELLSVLTWETGPGAVLTPRERGAGEARYAISAAEFELSVLRVGSGAAYDARERRSVEILLWTEGGGRIAAGPGDALSCARGSAVVVPAAAPRYRIEGEGVIYRAAVPEPAVAASVETA
jgi:mannose-6-phosphate isomerase